MKFGKRLRYLLEDSLPEWQNKFLSYKDLKKTLKSLPSSATPFPLVGGSTLEGNFPHHDEAIGVMSQERFVKLLNEELEKFNSFFMEKEEEFVIRMQMLREEIERLKSICPNNDLSLCTDCGGRVTDLRKAIVSLHGETVLLENYSSLNYTGLVKILKKHDKMTGSVLRYPFISTVLRQPFLTTEILSRLVKECEDYIQVMFPTHSAGSQVEDRSGVKSPHSGDDESSPSSPESSGPNQESGMDADVDAVYRSTITALRSLQEIRGSSKTPHPLLAEAASFPALTFQKPKDTESNADGDKGHCSASSTLGSQCCAASRRTDAETGGMEPAAGVACRAPKDNPCHLSTEPRHPAELDELEGSENRVSKRPRIDGAVTCSAESTKDYSSRGPH